MKYDPMFDAAKKVVDEVMGKGEYARINRNNPGVPPELRRPAIIRVIIRGYGDGVKVFEDRADIDDAALERVVGKMAEVHMRTLCKYEVHMLEFEFLDAPEDERFLRFGTDPRGMVMPIKVNL